MLDRYLESYDFPSSPLSIWLLPSALDAKGWVALRTRKERERESGWGINRNKLLFLLISVGKQDLCPRIILTVRFYLPYVTDYIFKDNVILYSFFNWFRV